MCIQCDVHFLLNRCVQTAVSKKPFLGSKAQGKQFAKGLIVLSVCLSCLYLKVVSDAVK